MKVTPAPGAPSRSVAQRLQHAEDFFMKKSSVHTTLGRLSRRLEEAAIPHAIVGGMALNLHGYERMTQDVDVLTTSEGLQKFVARCVGRDYAPAFPGAGKSFRDTESQVAVEFLIAGEYPGDGKPKAVAFPDPAEASIEMEDVRVIRLERLIELKLASGLSAPHRLRDLADVQDLIILRGLPLELEQQLDPSVRDEYRRLWDAAQSRET